MNFSEKIPPINSTREPVYFEKKRLQRWTETVPADIRRLEYDLFVRYKKLLHAQLYRLDNKEKCGRFTVFPGFTEDIEKESWKAFKDSFLIGEERKNRLAEILEQARKNIPGIIDKFSKNVPAEKIQMIALSGSGVYGPRRSGERLSDIDINFLVDEENLNFEIYPETEAGAIPYHSIVSGKSDNARGERYDIHWLLYPYFPIQKTIADKELKTITQKLIAATEKRKDEIAAKVSYLDQILKEKSQKQIFE